MKQGIIIEDLLTHIPLLIEKVKSPLCFACVPQQVYNLGTYTALKLDLVNRKVFLMTQETIALEVRSHKR